MATALGKREGAAIQKPTLVAFVDIECPFCRADYAKMRTMRDRHRTQIDLILRNLPLTSIHSQAFAAAVAVEAAREQGKPWEMYDALMEGGIDTYSIGVDIGLLKLDSERFKRASRTTAVDRVKNDLRDASRLGLRQTPSYVLCRPGQPPLLLGNLNSPQLLKILTDPRG